jgi:pimeloyl-ACP methyl ester carboxylesterase
VVVAATVLLTGTTPPASAENDPFDAYDDQTLTWGQCLFTPVEGALPSECAMVTVPRDWAAPTAGVDLRVSISRVRATGEHAGSILVNPGGPGGRGTSLAGALAALRPEVNESHAFIGMDPRGTGHEGGTEPADLGLVCSVPTDRLSDRTDLDARDRSAESIAEHRKAPRAVAEACQSDALTPYVTTWQTAHDMELVRRLLGESTLDYLGYSYGTWLGAKYASLFPSSAGRIVLDSSMNWQGRLQAAFEAFPAIGQRQFDEVFLPWMTRQFPEVVGATPAEAAQAWEGARAYLATKGIAPDNYDAVFVGMGDPLRFVLGALVFVLGVTGMNGEEPADAVADPDLARLLDERSLARFGVPFARLTPATVAAELRADYTLYPGTRFAVACGDQPVHDADWYRRLSDRQGPAYPLFGWAYGLSEVCGYWSDEPRQELPTLPSAVADRVLVIQGELDPQTGYEQARAAVRAAPGVSLVSVDNAAFHGQYAFDGNPCVDGMVNVFLIHGSRPGNATCPGIPLPGDTRVFPVDGPVRSTQEHAAVTVTADHGELRTAIRARINDVNHPVPVG